MYQFILQSNSLHNHDSLGTVLVEQQSIVTNESLTAKEKTTAQANDTRWVYVWIAALVGSVLITIAVIGYFKKRKT